jgi:hypothetical protein
MMIRINGGWLDGHLIRRARKAHRCDAWLGGKRGRCDNVILPGSYYAEGEPNDRAGGYGDDRLCLECAGPEAREAAPLFERRAAA